MSFFVNVLCIEIHIKVANIGVGFEEHISFLEHFFFGLFGDSFAILKFWIFLDNMFTIVVKGEEKKILKKKF